jgi:hypothetical protein
MSKDCQQAMKLLTQYERLAAKYGVKLPPDRLEILNRKRQDGSITSNDLPATLRRAFPGQFQGLTLNELYKICQTS